MAVETKVTVIRDYYASGEPSHVTTVTDAVHVVVDELGHLILRDGSNKTLAAFAPRTWESFHRDDAVGIEGKPSTSE